MMKETVTNIRWHLPVHILIKMGSNI